MAAPFVDRYVALLAFPVDQPQYVPSLLPIFLGFVTIQFYFGRWWHEELGWNSAVSNSVLLVATGLSLLLELGVLPGFGGARAAVATGIVVFGLTVLLLNYYHLWPAEIAFNVSSGFVSYTLAYIAITVAYTGSPVDDTTAAAASGVFLTFWAVSRGIRRVQRGAGMERPERRSWR